MSVAVRAETILIPASRDNTLFTHPEGLLSSGSGPGLWAGNNAQSNTRRALVFFDVAASIPAEAIIDSVELQMSVESAPNATPQTFIVHRLLCDWGEGASISTGGSGAASQPGDATWIHRFYPDSLWTAAGGDFDPASHATSIVGDAGLSRWKGNALTNDVAQWLDNSAHNFGWLIQGNEASPSTVRRFYSRETTTGPVLVVHFTAPTSVQHETWGRVKSRYRLR